jgi:hypothetical protein
MLETLTEIQGRQRFGQVIAELTDGVIETRSATSGCPCSKVTSSSAW